MAAPQHERFAINNMSKQTVAVDGLCKNFSGLVAVDNLSFSVSEGEILGFLGPNGAGKSTTMKMLTGFLEPDAGRVDICGHDITRAPVAAKKIIGYLPEGAPTYNEMTVRDFLHFIIAVRRLNKTQARNGFASVVDKLKIERVLNQSIETLSKGFKRRVGLAQALIHDPKVLVMDEPTDGLDPNQKHHTRQLINSLSQDKIVIISTHILEEVTAVCTRAMIISNGKQLLDESPDKLLARSRYDGAVSFIATDSTSQEDLSKHLKSLPEVKEVEVHNDERIYVFPQTGALVYPVVERCIRQKSWRVSELRVESGRLDEVFREVTADTLS